MMESSLNIHKELSVRRNMPFFPAVMDPDEPEEPGWEPVMLMYNLMSFDSNTDGNFNNVIINLKTKSHLLMNGKFNQR